MLALMIVMEPGPHDFLVEQCNYVEIQRYTAIVIKNVPDYQLTKDLISVVKTSFCE